MTLRKTWLASLAYALVYFALGTDKYVTYHSGADLGLFTQSIATAFHGFSNTMEGGSHFTFHFSPILYLCAPLLLWWRSALALIAIQAFACALTAPPLFLLARKRLPEDLAYKVAMVALLYPPLAGVAFSDFHENAFAPAATLWLLWAVDARRWVPASLFAVTLLSVKEDQSLFVAAASVFAWMYFRRRGEIDGVRFAGGTLAFSLFLFVAFFALVRPLAGAQGVWQPLHFYGLAHVDDPKAVAPMCSFGKVSYVLEAMLPLAFLCVLSPTIWLAVPPLAAVLLSQRSLVWTMGQHYAGCWIGYLLAAFAFGAAALYECSPRRAITAVNASLILSGLILVFASPTHWGHYLGMRTAHDAELDRAVERIPAAAEVGTHDEIFAHLGFDRNAHLGLSCIPMNAPSSGMRTCAISGGDMPEWAFFDRTFSTSYWVEKTLPELDRLVRSGRYRVVDRRDGIERYALVAHRGR